MRLNVLKVWALKGRAPNCNWLLEGSRPGASQLRIEALFSVGASAKKGAQWAREPRKTETQGHPLACSSAPLPAQGQRKNKKPLLEKSTNAVRHQDSRPSLFGDGEQSARAQPPSKPCCLWQPTNETRSSPCSSVSLPPARCVVGQKKQGRKQIIATPRASC